MNRFLSVDIYTLLLALFVLSLTLGAAVWFFARAMRSPELRGWAWAMAVHGTSYLFFMERGIWPDWIAIVVANAAFSASFALMLRATGQFFAAPPSPWLVWAPPPLVALWCALFVDSHGARIVGVNLAYFAQMIAILAVVMRTAQLPRGRGARLLIAGASLVAVVCAVRALTLLGGQADILAPMSQSPLQSLSYLSGLVGLLLASMGFVFMVVERIDRHVQEARHLLTTIFDSSDESIAMFDRDGTVLAANRTAAERFGALPQAMVGRNLADFMPAEASGPRLAAIRRVADGGPREELIDRRAGRDYRHIFSPVVGEPGRVVVYAADITDRLAAENALHERLAESQRLNRKLEEAHTQLLQSEKLASIGQLAAGVAHELNNPIGFVHSNLGTLKNYLDDILAIVDCGDCERAKALMIEKDYAFLKTDIYQLLAESREGLERVKKIVQDLKDFSRPGESSWQWADLHQGLDSTLNIVWNELKYKCTVTKDYGPLPQVRCLPSQLNQVFMNILVNAAHAIEDKGEIRIVTRAPDDKTVQIAIADTGRGIAPEHMNRLFEPFFTTKPVGKGTGLGLSIAWGIIQKHHGRIDVASEPGKGTTFTITLPVDPPVDEEPAVPPAPTFAGAARS